MSIKNSIKNNRIKHQVHTSSEGKGITKTKPPAETVPPPDKKGITKTKSPAETVPPPDIKGITKTEPPAETVPPSPPPEIKIISPTIPPSSSKKIFDYQKLLKSIDLMYYAKNMYDIYENALGVQKDCSPINLKSLKTLVYKISGLEDGIKQNNKPGTKPGKKYADLDLPTPLADHPIGTTATACNVVNNFIKLKLADYKTVGELEFQKAISLLHEVDSSLKAQDAIQEYCKQSSELNATATNAYKEFCEEIPDINALISWVES
jgi:hypothetical protein